MPRELTVIATMELIRWVCNQCFLVSNNFAFPHSFLFSWDRIGLPCSVFFRAMQSRTNCATYGKAQSTPFFKRSTMLRTTTPCPLLMCQRCFAGLLLAIAALTFSGNAAQGQGIVLPLTDTGSGEGAEQQKLDWESQRTNQILAEINADAQRTLQALHGDLDHAMAKELRRQAMHARLDAIVGFIFAAGLVIAAIKTFLKNMS